MFLFFKNLSQNLKTVTILDKLTIIICFLYFLTPPLRSPRYYIQMKCDSNSSQFKNCQIIDVTFTFHTITLLLRLIIKMLLLQIKNKHFGAYFLFFLFSGKLFNISLFISSLVLILCGCRPVDNATSSKLSLVVLTSILTFNLSPSFKSLI